MNLKVHGGIIMKLSEVIFRKEAIKEILMKLQHGDITYFDQIEQKIEELKELHYFINELYNLFCEMKRESEVLSITFSESAELNKNIAYANNSIANSTVQEAEATEKCYDLAEKFQKKFESLEKSLKSLSNDAKEANKIGKEGGESILELVSNVKIIQKVLFEMIENLDNLESTTNKVNKIVEIITKISKEAKLLSLNASIEASRAGELGKGFSIVAGEVRKLANSSDEAGKSISNLISESVEQINSILKLSKDAKNEYENQTKYIENAGKAITTINSSMFNFINQQTSVNNDIENLFEYKDQLIKSISDITAVSTELAATSQVVASVSMEQNNQDELISNLFKKFNNYNVDLDKKFEKINVETKVKNKKKIGVICLEDQEFYREVEEAAISTGKKLNIEVICKTPKRYNIEEQMKNFNKFIENKIDGIIITPGDSSKFKSLIDKTIDSGIKVVCVDIDVSDSKRNCFITSDSFKGGRQAGEAAATYLKGKGKIIVLLCASEVLTVKKRYQGFLDTISKYDDIKIVRVEEQKDTDLTKTKAILEKIISENSNFDLLYLVNSDAGEVAIDLWRKRNIKKKIIVLSKSSKVSNGVKEGIVIAQIVQRNRLWGEVAVKRLYELFEGKSIPSIEDTGMYEINKSNYIIFKNNKLS